MTQSDERLYGLPSDEHLEFDPATVYEHESWLNAQDDTWEERESTDPLVPGYMEPVPPPGFSFVIEEWSVAPPRRHLPAADRVLDYICEWVSDNGEIDEDGYDAWSSHADDPDVVAAFDAALDLLASKITYRMADKLVATHVVTFDAAGEPLLDGEPMYHPAAGVGDMAAHQEAAASRPVEP